MKILFIYFFWQSDCVESTPPLIDESPGSSSHFKNLSLDVRSDTSSSCTLSFTRRTMLPIGGNLFLLELGEVECKKQQVFSKDAQRNTKRHDNC